MPDNSYTRKINYVVFYQYLRKNCDLIARDSSLHHVSLRMTDNCVFGDGVVAAVLPTTPSLPKPLYILVILSEAKTSFASSRRQSHSFSRTVMNFNNEAD